jgi:hypothetical protein
VRIDEPRISTAQILSTDERGSRQQALQTETDG